MTAVRYEERHGRVLVPVKVVPGASRSRVVGLLGDRWKVAVAAPPEAGKANAEVERTVAASLGVRPGAVRVVSGATTARKTLAVLGVPAAALDAALSRAAAK